MTVGMQRRSDPPGAGLGAVAAVRAARRAQSAWAARSTPGRLVVVRRARQILVRHASELAATVRHAQRRSPAETLSAEILPLADACRFLERRAAALLRPRRVRGSGPLWLGRTRLVRRRDPLGVVLIVGPGNYPLFLPGVQAIQALVAGNAVILKPGRQGTEPAAALARVLARAGLPEGLLTVLSEAPDAAREAIDAGVDKVLLTGSADTGRAVLGRLASRLTPATLELAGCDAVFVRADADLELTVRALCFGLGLNGGATCLGPRRVFIAEALTDRLERRLRSAVAELPEVELDSTTAQTVCALAGEALDRGARVIAGSLPQNGRMRPLVLAGVGPDLALFQSGLMAPAMALFPVASDDEALAAAARCRYALGASIFSKNGGEELAARVSAGVVVVNDLIAPTADPRLAFGGRGDSGFGETRGPDGLLQLTALKTVVSRRGAWRPHLSPPASGDERLLLSLLRALHGSGRLRLRAIVELMRAGRDRRASRATSDRSTPPGRQPARKGVSR